MASGRKWLRRGRKLALWGLALAVVALLAFNVVLNLPPVKAKAERAMAARFGAPVELGWVRFFPPSSLRASGVQLGESDQALVTMDVVATLRGWETLSGWGERRAIVFDDVRCEDALIRLAVPSPDPEAEVDVPEPGIPATPAPAAPQPAPEAPKIAETKPAAPKPSPTAAPPADPPTSSPEKQALRIDVRSIVLSQASISIEDAASGREVATVDDVEVELAAKSGQDGAIGGEVKSGELKLVGETISEAATAKVAISNKGIDVTEIVVPVPGGQLVGRVRVGSATGSPFKMELRGSELAVVDLLGRAGGDQQVLVGGTADVTMRMQGLVSQPGAVRARARITSTDLALSGGGEGKASATFDFVSGRMLLTGARASTGGKLLRAVGELSRDGTMKVNARLYAAGASHLAVANRAASWREDAPPIEFTPLVETDWHFLDFRIAGSPRDPQADLWGDGVWVPLAQLAERLLETPAERTEAGNLIPVSEH